MKSMGIMELMSMFLLKRNQVSLNRDVILLAVADEEDGGTGMKYLVDHHWDELDCGTLINEGGLGLEDAIFPGQDMYPISVGEKGNIWLRMVAEGNSGHGSTPRPNEASEKLLHALARIQSIPETTEIYPVFGQFLANLGAHKGGAMSVIMRHRALRDLLVKPKLKANPLTKAAMMNTIHLTGFGGHNRPNVVASEVFAQFDCRILPGVVPEEFIATLKSVAGDDVRFEVIAARKGNQSTMDNPVYRALARHAVFGEPDAVAGPVISVGFTDSIYVRPKGTHAYGFLPVLLNEKEMNGFHGVDERISVDNVRNGTRKLYSAILEVVSE
jgi:acetylornithine deacetylase/succinyl-diaminopimelate desuccinylase-like protein